MIVDLEADERLLPPPPPPTGIDPVRVIVNCRQQVARLLGVVVEDD